MPVLVVEKGSSLIQEKNITKLLTLHEGERHHVYKCTGGYYTIGVGRNVDSRTGPGLSRSEIQYMLSNDIAEAVRNLNATFSWFHSLSDVRQAVLIDMHHNLGLTKLLGFRNTLRMISEGKYTEASRNMLKSKWATQVGKRAQRLSLMMRSNKWPREL